MFGKGKCLEEKKDGERRGGAYLGVGKIVATERVDVGNIKGSNKPKNWSK